MACIQQKMKGRKFKTLGDVQRELARVSKLCSKEIKEKFEVKPVVATIPNNVMNKLDKHRNVKIECEKVDDNLMVCREV